MQLNLKMVVVSHLTFNIYHLSFCEWNRIGNMLIALARENLIPGLSIR